MNRWESFRNSSSFGKVVLVCSSLFAFCCLCSVPVLLARPTSSNTSPTEIVSSLIESQVEAPTETAVPTNTAQNTSTSTSEPTDTPRATNTSRPLATQTTVPSPTATTMTLTARGASCIPDSPHQTGKVVDVVDGDTIKVLMDHDGQTYTVRYIGMDTPESTTQMEFFGPEASSRNVQLVFGKNAVLIKDVSETDRYGRLLRYVIVDGLFINYELVAQGFANTASFPPDIACIPTFQDAERQARTSTLGFWNVPPTSAPAPTLAPIVPSGGGGNTACSCGGPDLDCADFSSHSEAQSCYDYCQAQGFGDPHRLDGNHDGQACENLP